ncbi:MAG: alpha/beta hydrolase [Lachnospiraceae bacterium]|nr:alpha/beta hydrolase [Lachnospiraceae bacterium]
MGRKEEITFLSANKTTNVHAVKWIPEDGEYHAILQITHGMIEYIDRYDDFASFLNEQGILVVGHDHVGHGKSVNDQKDWGYMGTNHPDQVLVQDMHTLRNIIQSENKPLPYFMMAHSMGSYMLRKYITLYAQGLSGAIIMGTGYVAPIAVDAAFVVLNILKTIYGDRHRSHLAQNILYSRPYRQFDLTGKDFSNSWLTKDQKKVEEYYSRPDCTFMFTLNGYQALLCAVKYDCRQKNINKIPKELPVAFFSGENDPVGNLGKGVTKVYRMFQKAGMKDVSCKLYKDDRHEILNETDKDMVQQDIFKWMQKQIGTNAQTTPLK